MEKFVTPRRILASGILEEHGNSILEIGCGNGEFLLQLHEARPNAFILGLDISNLALRKALSRIKNLERTYVTKAEGRWFLHWIVPENSISEIYVLFPDPWPGREKRRLVDNDFVSLLAHKLKKGGKFVFATDVEDYYQDVLEIVEKSPFFEHINGMDAFYTKYERKWKAHGKKTFSLTAEKMKSPDHPLDAKAYLNRPLKTAVSAAYIKKLKGLELRRGNQFFKILEVYEGRGEFLLKTVFRMKNMGQKQFFLIRNQEIDLLPVQLEIYPEPLYEIIKALFGS